MSSFRKAQTVRRYSGGYWDDNGEWNDGTYEEVTIMASVQPLNVEELAQYAKLQPQGTSQFSAVKIYSNTLLGTAKQELPDGTILQEADILLWRGKEWKIVMPEEWQSGVIDHFRMIAWEVEPDAAGSEEISS